MTINGKPINFQLLHNCAGKSFVPIDYITADKNDETCTIRTIAEFSRVLNGVIKNSKNSGGTDLAFVVPGLRMEVTSICIIDSSDAPNKTISGIRFVPKDTDEPASVENPS